MHLWKPSLKFWNGQHKPAILDMYSRWTANHPKRMLYKSCIAGITWRDWFEMRRIFISPILRERCQWYILMPHKSLPHSCHVLFWIAMRIFCFTHIRILLLSLPSPVILETSTLVDTNKKYKALAKNKGGDIISPTVSTTDKTQVDTYGWMQMEPMIMSHSLLNHNVQSQHSAMWILGYTCRFLAHKPISKKGTNSAATDLPDGTVVGCGALKSIPGVSWSTYLLNEMHIQIKFILEESWFLELHCNSFNWKSTMDKFILLLHHWITFIMGIKRAMIAIVVITLPASAH